MGVCSRALEQKRDDRGERGGMEHRGRLVEGALAQEQLVTPIQPTRRVDDDDQRKEREGGLPRAEDAEEAVGQPHDEQPRQEVGTHQRAAEDAVAAANHLVRGTLDQHPRDGRGGRATAQPLASLGTAAIYADAEH